MSTIEDETGEKFQEYNVYHHNFVEVARGERIRHCRSSRRSPTPSSGSGSAASPYHGATANDIDWVAKVKMQGAIQKWVDHSISVTVNLPNNVSEGLVAQVYRTAWECGCKGVTVYRDGSPRRCARSKRDPKREAEVRGRIGRAGAQASASRSPADIVRFKNGTEDWIAFVGLQDGRPYEVFTGKIEEDAMYIPQQDQQGMYYQGTRGGRYASGTTSSTMTSYGYTNTHRRHLASVRRGVLELCQTDLGRACATVCRSRRLS